MSELINVKLLVGRSGPNVNQCPGEIIAVSKEEAIRMQKAKQCTIPRNLNKQTTAVNPVTEKAAK